MVHTINGYSMFQQVMGLCGRIWNDFSWTLVSTRRLICKGSAEDLQRYEDANWSSWRYFQRAMDTKSWSVNTFWLCHSGPNRFKLNASLSVQPSCFISPRTSPFITFQFHHFIPGTAPTPSIQTAFSWSKHESWNLLCKSRRALASCRQVLGPTTTSGDTHLQSAKLRVTSSYPANQSCYSFGPSRKHYFWGAQFSFSSADVLCEVPYDPQLQMFLSCTSPHWQIIPSTSHPKRQ